MNTINIFYLKFIKLEYNKALRQGELNQALRLRAEFNDLIKTLNIKHKQKAKLSL
jgi:hypothetical protein